MLKRKAVPRDGCQEGSEAAGEPQVSGKLCQRAGGRAQGAIEELQGPTFGPC